jgi:hypothetical protein
MLGMINRIAATSQAVNRGFIYGKYATARWA